MTINRRIKLLWIVFYLSITGAAINSAYLANVGLSEDSPLLLQLASLIGITFTAISSLIGVNFWKKKLKKKK